MTYLFDTDILVYAHDARTPEKQTRARDLMVRLERDADAALPVQALAEFANVGLRKLNAPADLVYRQLQDLIQVFAVIPLSEWVTLEASRGVRDHAFGYYDAQIWATAKLHRVPIVLSEDFSTGATVEGVTFLDPFREDFRLDTPR